MALKLYLVGRFLPSIRDAEVKMAAKLRSVFARPFRFARDSYRCNRQEAGKTAILLLAVIAILTFNSCRAAPSSQRGPIVKNEDLRSGQHSPDDWRTDSQDADAASFDWRQVEGRGELEISNRRPQDSRWSQTIHLTPGWYFFSASIRTEGIPEQGVGASLSILVGGVMSQGSSGTTPWHRVDFYLKVGEPADVALACRLGGYSSPNTGSAFYRDIQASRVDAPPPGATQIFDLDVERGIIPAGSNVTSHRLKLLIPGVVVFAMVAIVVAIRFGLGSKIRATSLGKSTAVTAQSHRETSAPGRRISWHPTSLELSLIVLGAAIFTLAFTYPILSKLMYIGVVWDWSEKLSHAWATVNTIKFFHQLPLWDPYSCGGMPLLANPLFSALTPWFGLDLIFGPVVGVNLQIPIHLAIAWAGGYVLARCLGMGVAGGITCGSVFAASSWFLVQVVVGHFEMMASAYLPWMLALFWESVERRRLTLCLGAALLVAIAFGEGGIYVCARVALLLPLLAIYLAIAQRDTWPLKVAAVLAIAAVGFCAIKLLPSAQLIRLHPRFIYEPEYNPVTRLLYAIFTRNQYWDHPSPPPGGFYEFGAYLSPIAAVLALLGIVGSMRRAMPWLLCAALLFSLALGSPRAWFPWALLRHLPVFSSMRIPSISLQTGFVLMVAMLSALGAEFLTARWQRYGLVLALAMTLCATLDAWTVTMPNARVTLMNRFHNMPASPEFRQYFGVPFDMFATALSNHGSVYCNESLDFSNLPENVLGSNQPGYFGEQYLIGPGSIDLLRWTPNALTFHIDARGDTPRNRIVVVNQNYDPSWRIGKGSGEVFSEGGLIGIRLPEGEQELELVYRNYFFYLGAFITFVTGVLSLLVWRHERRISEAH